MSKPSYTPEVEQEVLALINNGSNFINAAKEVGVSYNVIRRIAKKNNLRSPFSRADHIRALLADPNFVALKLLRRRELHRAQIKEVLAKRKTRAQTRLEVLVKKRGKQFIKKLQAGHTIKEAAWICGISVRIGEIIIAREEAAQAKAPHTPGNPEATMSANPCVPR